MNKEIKIIDLLNIIAEGKEVPSIIKYEKVPWFYDDGRDDYYREVLGQGKEYLFQTMFDIKVVYMFINNTVEIIEEDIPQPEDVLSFTLTDKVWTPRQARELIENFRKISEKLKSKKDNNKIEKLKRITKCIGTDEEGTYYTDEYTIPELVVKIDEIIDHINNLEKR